MAHSKQIYISEEANDLIGKFRNTYLDRVIENKEWKQDSQDVMEADFIATATVSGLIIKHLNRIIESFDDYRFSNTRNEVHEYISVGK